MRRISTFARRHGFDFLIVFGAIEAALEAACRDAVLEPGPRRGSPPRRSRSSCSRCSRGAACRSPRRCRSGWWRPALSFVDGELVMSSSACFAAGMAAAFLLGSLPNAAQGRIGLAVTLGGAAIIVYNDPAHAAREFLFTPALFAIAWLAGFALRERSAQAESAEERAVEAEREREENARRAVFDERVRIARELHDVVAHHVSMMGVQAGAARLVIDRDPGKAKEALAAIETLQPAGGRGAAPAARVPAPGRRRRRPRPATGPGAARRSWRRA